MPEHTIDIIQHLEYCNFYTNTAKTLPSIKMTIYLRRRPDVHTKHALTRLVQKQTSFMQHSTPTLTLQRHSSSNWNEVSIYFTEVAPEIFILGAYTEFGDESPSRVQGQSR